MNWISQINQESQVVNVMGTIVDILCCPPQFPSRKPIIYQIDDGTGVIKIVYFPPQKELYQAFDVGTTVDVKGTVQMFQNNAEIKAFRLRKVLDAKDEIDRMLVLDELRRPKHN